MYSIQPAFVSIIIPVFNDNQHLQICLEAIAQQTYPSEHYEIIVVDNNSKEDVSSVTALFENVVLIHEPSPGSYIARNRGIEVARGEIIAFTDADCIPEPAWLANGVKALQSEPNVGLVAGHIELFVSDSNYPNPFELYETIALAFPQDQFLANDNFGVTANLLTFKHILDAVGLFDETLKSGGDKQWGQRVFAAGYKQLYAEDARVNHPARDTWDALRKRAVRIIGGRYDVLKSNRPSAIALLTDLVIFLKPPFRFFLRTWQDTRLKGPRQKFQFTVVMLRLRWVAIQERFRLQFGGGVSERG
ncbi:glycosyltransferase [Leptolyngbya sp. CCNP1308]|uniref:glycosyltransferase n=1 Tax=Leptolyngbya sp. CCNP1308 TaxID=3110255 RepID=UPI002B207B83|nr:glycosyltransferase [Leptolyngbya sp. CCNP1308]MEA5448615.1 glycosyltransferase [Leptolyngbya sp. CCNP1308]